ALSVKYRSTIDFEVPIAAANSSMDRSGPLWCTARRACRLSSRRRSARCVCQRRERPSTSVSALPLAAARLRWRGAVVTLFTYSEYQVLLVLDTSRRPTVADRSWPRPRSEDL